ncbi:MAG TPA: ATP-binding protein [Nocardioides sp.]|uniref:ATP-binding protein n=1 Tax=Nocardioides sp. TaxID=35761 RepID=UPI002C7A8E79|nr:ATP-binding protein [Nocardioides sp.]HTW16518.1 ATP-binding protein [Nocardioides sp.]
MTSTAEPPLDARTILVLPPATRVTGIARRVMSRQLFEHGARPDLIEDAELVLSELVTNALQHGGSDSPEDLEVSWALTGGRLRLSVLDGGICDGDLRVRDAAPDSLSGRGLAIVDCLCERWSVEHDGGTRVTADLATAV